MASSGPARVSSWEAQGQLPEGNGREGKGREGSLQGEQRNSRYGQEKGLFKTHAKLTDPLLVPASVSPLIE